MVAHRSAEGTRPGDAAGAQSSGAVHRLPEEGARQPARPGRERHHHHPPREDPHAAHRARLAGRQDCHLPRGGRPRPQQHPGDLVFVLEDAPHAQFERDGHDLVYRVRVPLVHALTGCSVDVQTLDGRLLHVSVHDVVFPGFEKVVRGEGMPAPGGPSLPGHGRPPPPGRQRSRGDLIIRFDVDFPRRLSQMQRHALRAILLAGSS